jgi:hypothetical protein
LAAAPGLGIIATYAIARLNHRRAGRIQNKFGRPALPNHRGGVGGKLGRLLHQSGLVVVWEGATAHVVDTTLQWLMRPCEARMLILSDTACQAAEGAPSNLTLCQRGEGDDHLLVAPGLARLTRGSPFKKAMHRVWASFHARLAFTRAAFHVLVQWHGFRPNAAGFVPLSIAELNL